MSISEYVVSINKEMMTGYRPRDVLLEEVVRLKGLLAVLAAVQLLCHKQPAALSRARGVQDDGLAYAGRGEGLGWRDR